MGRLNNKISFKLFGFSDLTIRKLTVCLLGIFLIGIVACQQSAVKTSSSVIPGIPFTL
jgi:hypothetical protein